MREQFIRTEMLLGNEALFKLASKRVALFGVGGVGGHAAEALARSGVGQIDLIDDDVVVLSNLNRQLAATWRTLGMPKVEAMRQRLLEVAPDCIVRTHRCFYLPENADSFDFTAYDYVIDAVDTVTAKINLVLQAQASHTPIVSSMGAGNKLDPSAFEVADIYETSVCPLARVMRRELKKRGVKELKVVYSREKPLAPVTAAESGTTLGGGAVSESAAAAEGGAIPVEGSGGRRAVPGSVAFVPSVAGMILAGEVVRDLVR